MRTAVFFFLLSLAIALPASAQTVDRLYIMDCGHNAAADQARWSPGVNIGKPLELSDNCYLLKHGTQWLLWDTGYPDAVADKPLANPIGPATRAKKLAAQLAELFRRFSTPPADPLGPPPDTARLEAKYTAAAIAAQQLAIFNAIISLQHPDHAPRHHPRPRHPTKPPPPRPATAP